MHVIKLFYPFSIVNQHFANGISFRANNQAVNYKGTDGMTSPRCIHNEGYSYATGAIASYVARFHHHETE